MLRLRNHFDCLVIGAGPSASVLAMTLSGWGRKVAMVELGRQLNAWDLDDVGDLDRPLLKRLGLGAAIRHAGTSCPRRRLLLWGDGRASEQKLEKSDYALRVDRELFDLDLRNMARALGVEVFGPARLESALPEDGRGMVEISLAGGKIRLRAETIVLACGRRLDPRLMPLVVEHSGPESLALQAPVRALGQRARVDAVEALPFGFLRWRSAGMPGAWGRVEVVIDRERQDEDPVEVIAEALEGSGIGFGEIELDDAGRREAGARLVGSRWPVFMAGSSAAMAVGIASAT